MTLNFSNPSRSFDEKRNAVRFSGYDGMFEIVFYVTSAALAKARSERYGAATATVETSSLMAFDAVRVSIYDAARKVYIGKAQPVYTLTATDLH
jgi:hypothetical protein